MKTSNNKSNIGAAKMAQCAAGTTASTTIMKTKAAATHQSSASIMAAVSSPAANMATSILNCSRGILYRQSNAHITPDLPSVLEGRFNISQGMNNSAVGGNGASVILHQNAAMAMVAPATTTTTTATTTAATTSISNDDSNDTNANGDGNSDGDGEGNDDNEVGDGNESIGSSMETLSDNVSIWVDGEKHWISGVDGQTTCSDLICALLNYQNRQPQLERQQQQQHGQHQMFDEANNGGSVCNNNNKNNKSKRINNYNSGSIGNGSGSGSGKDSNKTVGNHAINQSIVNTKEMLCGSGGSSSSNNDNKAVGSGAAPTAVVAPTIAPAFPAGPMPRADIAAAAVPSPVLSSTTTTAAMATMFCDYVIVKQHRHYEEYLDGSTKVFDVLPARDLPGEKECELFLRRLAPSPHATNVSSLLSTDKDSGMGSPVGSSRSARFRRRKYKSSSWLAQGNTLHPKYAYRSRNGAANERLLKIILAQDETIQRQLSLLREKERQITKIEEDKHRRREKELGKNYLLETYLNGLEEADLTPEELKSGVEIFIDEPYQRSPIAATTTVTVAPESSAVITKIPGGKQKSHSERKEKRKMRKDKPGNIHKEAAPHGAAVGMDGLPTHAIGEAAAGNQGEIALQVLWLEKVYAVNKRLQREEEQLLKLHTKIRKHAVKRAYQARKEVLQQIDQLDETLAFKYAEARQAEEQLITSCAELQQKLGLLEQLSQEVGKSEEGPAAMRNTPNTEQASVPAAEPSPSINVNLSPHVPLRQHPRQEPTTSTNNMETTSPPPTCVTNLLPPQALKLQLNNVLYSPEDLLQLQQLIAKPTVALPQQQQQPVGAGLLSNCVPQPQPRPQSRPQKQQSGGNYPISALHHNCDISFTSSSLSPCASAAVAVAATDTCIAPTSDSVLSHATYATFCSAQQLIEKNTLQPLHVNNTKTVKKQMFCPKSRHQVVSPAPAPAPAPVQESSTSSTLSLPAVAAAAEAVTTAPISQNNHVGNITQPPATLLPQHTQTTATSAPRPTDKRFDISQLGTLV